MLCAAACTLLIFALFSIASGEREYVNSYAIKVVPGTDAKLLASKHQMIFKQKVLFDDNIFVFDAPHADHDPKFHLSPAITWFERLYLVTMEKRTFNPSEWADPQYVDESQNHLRDDSFPNDINVVGAWAAGYLGSGILVSIIDDGVDPTSIDLDVQQNGNPKFVSSASYDYNGVDDDPSPEDGSTHGAACAGLVGAASNDFCGVGVAPLSNIAGIRLIAAEYTPVDEANALNFALEFVDIYSNSWGPADDANIHTLISQMTETAFMNGVTNGRGGLGAIYVWAGGNGRFANDNSNYENYANSRFTIAVGAIERQSGRYAEYSEPGANLVVVAPTGEDGYAVTTSTTGDKCIADFAGTSASCPMVSGVIALMLEANPNLTWRDVQAVLVNTAAENDPNEPDWTVNGAGLAVNHNYGFGLVDAASAVSAAESWTNLPTETSPRDSGDINVNIMIPDNSATPTTSIYVVAIPGKVEFIDIYVTITHPYIGDLVITLTAPSGLESRLAEERTVSGDNYDNYRFGSIRHWGENPAGDWTIAVSDVAAGNTGQFVSWRLVAHGVFSCSSGEVEENGSCVSCNPPCVTCTGDRDTCTSCNAPLVAINGECVPCSAGEVEENGSCVSCNLPCVTCSGDRDTCDSCNTPLVAINGECVPCSAGEVEENGSCVSCNPPCVTCTGDRDTCTSCNAPLVAINGECVPCSAGEVEENGSCVSCNLPCVTCSGDRDTCTSCNAPLVAINGECVPCSAGEVEENGSCVSCNPPCVTCSGDRDTCTSCNTPLVAINGECVPCSAGEVEENGSCVSCNLPCVTCSGDRDTCTSCNAPLVAINGECVPCSAGEVEENGSCVSCNPPCVTCTSDKDSCNSCSLPLVVTDRTCACPQNTLFNNGNCCEIPEYECATSYTVYTDHLCGDKQCGNIPSPLYLGFCYDTAGCECSIVQTSGVASGEEVTSGIYEIYSYAITVDTLKSDMCSFRVNVQDSCNPNGPKVICPTQPILVSTRAGCSIEGVRCGWMPPVFLGSCSDDSRCSCGIEQISGPLPNEPLVPGEYFIESIATNSMGFQASESCKRTVRVQ